MLKVVPVPIRGMSIVKIRLGNICLNFGLILGLGSNRKQRVVYKSNINYSKNDKTLWNSKESMKSNRYFRNNN